MTYTGVLFDLYGTLWVYGDMKRAWSDWIDDMLKGLRALGLDIDRDEVSRRCDGFFQGAPQALEGLTVYETRIFQLALALGTKPSVQWCQELATESLVLWQSQVSLDSEALEALRCLHAAGIRIGILSNFDHYPHVHALLEQEGLLPFLDAVVVSGEVGLKKPDPAIFALALERLGTSPQQTVFVGDHPELDFEGSEQAGLVAMLLQRSTPMERQQNNYYDDSAQAVEPECEKNAHRVVRSLSEAVEYILS